MNNRENMQRTAAISQHFALWQVAFKEAITTALARNNRHSMAVAIPLALANRAANDIARDNQFRIKTAEEVVSGLEEFEGKGLIVYYFPTLMKESDHELFISRLEAYAANKIVILFVLLTQEISTPDHSILKRAWDVGLFQRGELYEVDSACCQVTLSSLKLAGFPPLQWWRRKQLASWPEIPTDDKRGGLCRTLLDALPLL